MSDYETITKDIKSCPFCGSNKVRLQGVIFPCVVCDECKTYGPVGFSKEDAVDKWNGELKDRTIADSVEIIKNKDRFRTI